MIRRAVVAFSLGLVVTACEDSAALKASAPLPQLSSPARVPTAQARTYQEGGRDDGLEAQIQQRLKTAAVQAFRGVSVSVWNGQAVLMGAVPRPVQRRQAEEIAATTPGVSATINELVLAEDGALALFIPDTTRQARIRQELNLPEAIIVRMVNNALFLQGNVADKAEAEALRADAGEIDGVKWVVTHLDGGK